MKTKEFELIEYEYEYADNGAILVNPEERIVEICGEEIDNKVSLIGRNIYADIENHLHEHNATAVRVTVKLKVIEPKY